MSLNWDNERGEIEIRSQTNLIALHHPKLTICPCFQRMSAQRTQNPRVMQVPVIAAAVMLQEW